MSAGDIDLYELNEAFASVVLRFMQALDIPPRQDQRQWRRHRHGPSAGRHRRDDPRHAARRAGAHAAWAPASSRSASAPAWAPPPSSSASRSCHDRLRGGRGRHRRHRLEHDRAADERAQRGLGRALCRAGGDGDQGRGGQGRHHHLQEARLPRRRRSDGARTRRRRGEPDGVHHALSRADARHREDAASRSAPRSTAPRWAAATRSRWPATAASPPPIPASASACRK